MQSEFNFDFLLESDAPTETPLTWLVRTYQTRVEWQSKAEALFVSVNGDSHVARNRLAAMVRQYFDKNRFEPEEVRRWKSGSNEPETIRIIPPKSTESNSGYVDWLYIADVLLMAGCAQARLRDEENQTRETEYLNVLRSYEMRLTVENIRKELRRSPGLSDECLGDRVENAGKEIPAVAFKEARRLEKRGTATPVPRVPIRSAPIPRYKPLYFEQ